jgi:succinylglutamate desuccinylase
MDVEEDKKEDITSSSKPKLNLNKIKNIIQKYEKEVSSLKKISIHKKLNNIIKKITKKIKVEITKDVVNYGNILETYSSKKTNKNVNDLLNAFYHLVLNKINSKIDG